MNHMAISMSRELERPEKGSFSHTKKTYRMEQGGCTGIATPNGAMGNWCVVMTNDETCGRRNGAKSCLMTAWHLLFFIRKHYFSCQSIQSLVVTGVLLLTPTYLNLFATGI